MKRFSAQYILTGCEPPLKRAVISAREDGTILSIEYKDGILEESSSVEFHNGVIIPGFINCHCHLELSHMKGAIPPSGGLGDFIMKVRNRRGDAAGEPAEYAAEADKEMQREGIVLCADICNSNETFTIKRESRIKYFNLLEVFGIDAAKAQKRIDEISHLAEEAGQKGLKWHITPHSVYSVSLPLFRLLKEKTKNNSITSIHFLESRNETEFLTSHTGPIRDSYAASGILPEELILPENHREAILREVTQSGNLVLVHNTYADNEIICSLKERSNTYFCLCPNSNVFIEDRLPPVELLKKEGCEIVLGTDSLASNRKLSILGEMKTIQKGAPSVTLEELVKWATANGARALGEKETYGEIKPGKQPGLLLLENLDLENLMLTEETTVRRLL